MFGSGRVSFVGNHIILMETLISVRENLMTPETSLFEIMNMAYIITGPVFVILALLYSLNSCVNPWIYLAFNKELPKLLLRHYTASSKNYRTAAGGKTRPSDCFYIDLKRSSLNTFLLICSALLVALFELFPSHCYPDQTNWTPRRQKITPKQLQTKRQIYCQQKT
jgi:hypothetical protein